MGWLVAVGWLFCGGGWCGFLFVAWRGVWCCARCVVASPAGLGRLGLLGCVGGCAGLGVCLGWRGWARWCVGACSVAWVCGGGGGRVGVCASDRGVFGGGLPWLALCVVAGFGLGGVRFCLCVAFSVGGSWVGALALGAASLPGLVLVPRAVVCRFCLCCACGRGGRSGGFFGWRGLGVGLGGSAGLGVLASLLRLVAAGVCSCASPLSGVVASGLWLGVGALGSGFGAAGGVRRLLAWRLSDRVR